MQSPSPPRPSPFQRLQRVPFRIILPNLVTLLALCLGLTSVRFAAEGRFELAVWLVVAAAILDGLDGRIARAIRGTSRFGVELDSIADMIDFGVAPALILWFWSLHTSPRLGWLVVTIFVVACSLRLARFNVMNDDPHRPAWKNKFFVGMPSPAGGLCALLPVYLGLSGFHLPESAFLQWVWPLYILSIAFLMSSPLPHFSGKGLGRVPREYVIFVLFAIALCGLLLFIYTMETLAIFVVIYLCLIPFSIRTYQRYCHPTSSSIS